MSSSVIKAVLFDAGGVLHKSSGSQSEDLKRELGLTDEQISYFYSHYLPLLGKGLLSEEELWDELHRKFHIRKVKTTERLMTRAWAQSLKKIPGMYELINTLKNMGIEVGLLSNVTPQFAQVLEERGYYEPFEIRILSIETGLWKPEAAIYKTALQMLGMIPEEVVFIDDQEENVEASKALGLHGIKFINLEQVKSDLGELINLT